jgi:GntR family transcriptional regulator, gluconate operon transcriptional repressor
MNVAPLGPILRRKLSSDVTRALREAILTGLYQPGDHLTEAQIAREMQVSHGPVREALRELAAEELIVIESHRGAFVKSFTADDVREIYSMRCMLETAMVKLAIERVTEADIAALDSLIEDMRKAANDEEPATLIELDLAFHRQLCSLSGHRRLVEAWDRLASPIRLFLTMAIPKYLDLRDAAESHPPIVRALRRRDAEAAIRHMETGVLQVGERIATAMGSDTVIVRQRLEHRAPAVAQP